MAKDKLSGKLAVILHADIVGSTALVHQDEQLAHQRIQDDFRHTCASRLIQNGLSLYEVASILGHRDVQTTQRYAHLESRDVSQRARDIMEALNGVPESASVETNLRVVGQGL